MEIVTKIAPIALALIMLGLGLGLTGKDFTRVVKQPKDFLVGFVCQLFILPIIAFILIKIFGTPPELALGVMILAAAPGGVTSNILTKFANGDVALSVSLTAIISLISIITVPFIVLKSADLLQISYLSKEISVVGIASKMFIVVTLPVVIGMLIRRFAENFVIANEPKFVKFSAILFVIVLFSAIYEEKNNIITYFAQSGAITLALNLIMMIVAYCIAQLLATGIGQKKCITLECGLQNGTLAIFVATTIFDGGVYVIPAATYALIMFITSLIFVYLVRKIN